MSDSTKASSPVAAAATNNNNEPHLLPPSGSDSASASASSTSWSILAGIFTQPPRERAWLASLPSDEEASFQEKTVYVSAGDQKGSDGDLLDFLVDDHWVYLGTRADLRRKKRAKEMLLRKDKQK